MNDTRVWADCTRW